MPSKRSGGSKKKEAPKKRTAPSTPPAGAKKSKTSPRPFEDAARLFLKEFPDAKEVAPEGVKAPMSGMRVKAGVLDVAEQMQANVVTSAQAPIAKAVLCSEFVVAPRTSAAFRNGLSIKALQQALQSSQYWD